MTEKLKLCEGEHTLHVYYCEEPNPMDSYYMGVCTRCGLYEEVPVRKLEEVFNNGI